MSTITLLIDGETAFTRDLATPAPTPIPTPTPAPAGPPAASGGLPKPSTKEELQALLQAVVDRGGGGIMLDPATKLSFAGTVDVALKDTGDDGCHFNFGGARFTSLNKDGATPAFRFASAGGGNVRHVTIENLTLYGGGYDTAGCGDGVEIVASGGAILLATLRSLRSSWCGKNGFLIKGDIFESEVYGLNAKDNKESGVLFDNTPGVVSNIMMYGSNLSRNRGYGLHTINGVQSIDLFGGSFVNNDVGAVKGAIRSAYGINGENTGEVMFDLGWCPYPVTINGCNLSSNGRWKNPANSNSLPSRYLIRYDASSHGALLQAGNYVVPYTENTEPAPTNMALLAP